MTPGALGPAGMSARMQEIQEKMRSVFGSSWDGSDEFAHTLNGQAGATGGIGLNGNAPLDPSQLGISADGNGQIKELATASAAKYGINPDLFLALVNQESGFNPLARSSKGAVGLTQLMPGTAKEMGVTNSLDPAQNLDGGAKYLAKMLDQWGTPELALAAYNAGSTAVEKAGGVPHNPETENYVKSILSQASKRMSP